LDAEGLIGASYRRGTAEILGAAHDDYNLSVDRRFSEAQLRAAIEANPRSLVFPLELARFYEVQGMWRECEDMAVSALARDPCHPEALFKATLAQWQLKTLSPAAAAAIFETLVSGEDIPPGWRCEISNAYLAAGEVEAALRHINKALQADPLNQLHYLQKLRCLLEAGRWQEAELALDAARRLGPVAKVYQEIHASLLARRGAFAAAMQAEQAILRDDPKDMRSLLHLATLAEQTGCAPEALAFFHAAMPFPPEHEHILEEVVTRLTALQQTHSAPNIPRT